MEMGISEIKNRARQLLADHHGSVLGFLWPTFVAYIVYVSAVSCLDSDILTWLCSISVSLVTYINLLDLFYFKDQRDLNHRPTVSPFTELKTYGSKALIKYIQIIVLQNIFVTLWYMLLLIPGMIKRFSYSQALYLYHDDLVNHRPERRAIDYITLSRQMMDGYKADLFWLRLSFIGWHILAILTLGILYVWLYPYLMLSDIVFHEKLQLEPKNQNM